MSSTINFHHSKCITIIRNNNLYDDQLRCDTQLKVAHCSTSWNSVLLFGGAVPQIVELFLNLWNNDLLSAPPFQFLGRCFTNCGTVPQKVELFHFVSVLLDTAHLSSYNNNCRRGSRCLFVNYFKLFTNGRTESVDLDFQLLSFLGKLCGVVFHISFWLISSHIYLWRTLANVYLCVKTGTTYCKVM